MHADHDSIFGDTVHGVPNPYVPHRHPYPTRYHGTMLQMPMPGYPYMEQSYAVVPFAGTERPPLLSSLTGYTWGDALVGAAFGYLVAPSNGQRGLWTGIGGVAALLTGTLGVLGTAGLAFYARSRQG